MTEAMDITAMNLYQKLAKVRDIADVVAKNKAGYGYKYVSEDEILSKVKAGMSKYHVSIFPLLDQENFEIERREYVKKKYDKATQGWVDDPQVEYCVRGRLNFQIVNDDNPADQQIIPWVLVGSQSDDAQAFGAALTYANRYFFMKFFNIATPDADPDEWKRKKAEAASADQAEAVAELVRRLDELVRANTTEQNRAEITAIIKQHLRIDGKPSSNYMKIRSLDDAQAVYSAISKYITESASSAKQTNGNQTKE
jgi:hypothetical protein